MKILRSVADLRHATADWRRAGQVMGVVPTMGALHDGHLALVGRARADCDRVIATIFVNPKQFNSAEDLAKYPRTEEADAEKLRAAGVDVLFAPAADEVYPAGFATAVSVSADLTGVLEGAFRPGHFDGMATVVTKLFLMTQADRAYFGEKDWQQLQVVRRMVADLNIPVSVIPCATHREADGLAMSSRNVRLSPEGRARAPALFAAMTRAAAALREGAGPEALAAAEAEVLAAGFTAVDYLTLAGAEDLAPMTRLDRPGRLLVAAWLDGVRLIDNIAV